MNKIDLSKEAEALLLMSRLNPTNVEVDLTKEYLKESSFNYTLFVSLAIDHRVSQLVYKNMLDNDIHRFLPVKWRNSIEAFYYFVKRRNEFIFNKIDVIFSDLNSSDIPYASLKGTMLLHDIYVDYGLRLFNDIDILVKENNLSLVTSLLNNLGFEQMIFDKENARLQSVSKKQKIFHRMSTHELIPFYLNINNEECRHIEIDIQFDIFNRGKFLKQAFYIKSVFEELNKVRLKSGLMITVLKPEYNILQLASHLYQDATRILTIREGKDLELIKFVDIYEFVKKHFNNIDWDLLAEVVNKNHINHILYYSLHHTEVLLGSFVPENFMQVIKPNDLKYLDTYGTDENLFIKWEIPFIKRMFRTDRKQMISVNEVSERSEYYKTMKMFEH